MNRARELRQRAERYWRLRRQISDPAAIQAIHDVAGELEMTAEELETRQRVQERAYALWMAHDCPEGRDVVARQL
jgi:hypothetical protein